MTQRTLVDSAAGDDPGTGLRAVRSLRELADRRMVHGARLAHAPLAGLISTWRGLGYLSLEKS